MGGDLQRPDDHGGSDRPSGASQRDLGTKRTQLSCGRGEKEENFWADRPRVPLGGLLHLFLALTKAGFLWRNNGKNNCRQNELLIDAGQRDPGSRQ